MDNFDEYQKLMRYKYGYHSFFIISVLSLINYIFDIQWAETKSLEFILIILLAGGYFYAMSVYKGAYFQKNETPTLWAIIFLFLGLGNIYPSFSPHSPLMTDGLVTSNSIMFVAGFIWLSIPIAYFTRILVEKRRDSKDIDDE